MKNWKVLALVLAVALLVLPVVAMADDAQVSVIGTGAVTFKPDTATITLGVSEVATGAVEAQRIANEKIGAVKQALIDQGVSEKEISISELSLWARYDYSGETEQLVGYSASHTLSIKTAKMDSVGPLIDAALAAGANQLQGVTFSVENSDKAYDTALGLAAERAREKAEVLAKAAGKALGELESLAESTDYGYYYGLESRAKVLVEDGAGGDAPTQVDVGMVTINATVNAVYELKD
jgi:uncharacterized protein YggE